MTGSAIADTCGKAIVTASSMVDVNCPGQYDGAVTTNADGRSGWRRRW